MLSQDKCSHVLGQAETCFYLWIEQKSQRPNQDLFFDTKLEKSHVRELRWSTTFTDTVTSKKKVGEGISDCGLWKSWNTKTIIGGNLLVWSRTRWVVIVTSTLLERWKAHYEKILRTSQWLNSRLEGQKREMVLQWTCCKVKMWENQTHKTEQS